MGIGHWACRRDKGDKEEGGDKAEIYLIIPPCLPHLPHLPHTPTPHSLLPTPHLKYSIAVDTHCVCPQRLRVPSRLLHNL
ncbi:hypothetical protein FBB35_03645 [Nostoc sp. TCL240-02]|nr:hypothetical protein FBB35_03645 [Nostoc sp. TCL240-02]